MLLGHQAMIILFEPQLEHTLPPRELKAALAPLDWKRWFAYIAQERRDCTTLRLNVRQQGGRLR